LRRGGAEQIASLYLHEVSGANLGSFLFLAIEQHRRWQERWTRLVVSEGPVLGGSESTQRLCNGAAYGTSRSFITGSIWHHWPNWRAKPLALPLALDCSIAIGAQQTGGPMRSKPRILLQRGIETQLTIVGSGEVKAC